jgi:multiple sugar transport system permease protein
MPTGAMTFVRRPGLEVDHAAVKGAARRLRRRRVLTAYAFLCPNLIVFGAFMLVPIGWVIRQSLMEGGVLGPAEWNGLENWSEALADERLLRSLGNTVRYTLLVVPAMTVLALGTALLLRGFTRRGRGIAQAAVYLPSLAPFVLSATVWFFMVHPDFGLLSLGARITGGAPINWLGDERLALPALAMLEIWRGTGFWTLFLLAALLGVASDLYEAAELDGAPRWRRFVHITLPAIRTPVLISVLLATLVAMQMFDPAFVLTQGGPAGATETAVLYIYLSVFESNQPGYGAVLSLILLAAILLLTAVVLRAGGARSR